MFNGLDTAGSGMSMAKKWMEVTSNNLSNINTTRGAGGGPYKRQTVVLEERQDFKSMFEGSVSSGVRIKEIVKDDNENIVYDPDHPDAMENGYVRMPAIDLSAEMVNLVVAQRAYEGNVSAFNSNKQMLDKALEIGKF